MGICVQQHRICTGRYNSMYFKECKFVNKTKDDLSVGEVLKISVSVVGLICYMYIICLLMALCIETSLSSSASETYTTLHFIKFHEIHIYKYRELGL